MGRGCLLGALLLRLRLRRLELGRLPRRGDRVLVYQYLVILTGVSTGILLLGEDFGIGQLVGAAVILAGVYLARSK